MLHAMSRRALWIPFAVVALAPLAVACDALKKDTPDAAVVVAPPAATPAAVAPADPKAAAAAAAATMPVAPLGAVTVTPGGGAVKPVAATDGGKPADAGAVVVTDGGKTAPTPTPTFVIPTAIPGFDAGGFKPPPGFPTAIPTFPPPAK